MPSKIVIDGNGNPLTRSSPVAGTLAPTDLVNAYNLASRPSSGVGVVAIVVAFDDPSAEKDMNAYRQYYGLPQCTSKNRCFHKVNQRGDIRPLPVKDDRWHMETSLDLDMVSAVCPLCNILLVETDSANLRDLFAGVDEAASAGASVISTSWGATVGEYASELEDEIHFNRTPAEITAAAGDGGYGLLYPAASQFVVSVGGTTLLRNSATTRGWDEVVWRNTGSGCSAYIPKPAWQTISACDGRIDNDVAAVAENLSVYDSQASTKNPWIVMSGTSASSPIIAAMSALAGGWQGGPAALYQRADRFFDITEGSNGTCNHAYLCVALPGYDAPTGLGSPNGIGAFTPNN